jgi:hypothetical protein
VPIDIDVGLNDAGTTLAPQVLAQPANGTATVGPDGLVTYTPDAAFTGIDTFTYQICSPTDPDVGDAAVTTTQDTPVSGAVITMAPDDPSVAHSLGAPPVNGTATVNPDGTFTKPRHRDSPAPTRSPSSAAARSPGSATPAP